MEELRGFAIEGMIADFVENPPTLLTAENVSGVSLRLDDFWLLWERSTKWPAFGPYYPWGPPPMWRELRQFHGYRHDFAGRPPNWSSYCLRRGYPTNAHPVTIVVALRAPFYPRLLDELPRSVGFHPIIYEHRPPAIGYMLAPGDFLGCADEGTLGGFLWNTVSSEYEAMSCGHVLGPTGRAYSPRPNIFGARAEIGNVTSCHTPTSNAAKCNRKIQPSAPVVDLALVTIDSGTATSTSVPGVGRIIKDSTIADIDQDDQVEFVGQKSGRVQAKIAELSIWKEIRINGASTCFSDLFVIDHVVFPYIASNLAQPGDSGSWIVSSNGSTASWDGMLIGGDGIRAYCCFAENIMAALAGQPRILP